MNRKERRENMQNSIENMVMAVSDGGHIILRADGRSRDSLRLLIEDGEFQLDLHTYYGGDGVPEAEWHQRRLVLHIKSGQMIVDPDKLRDALEQARPLVERVIAGHSVEWDGSNYVGRLTDDASASLDALDDLFARADLSDDRYMLWDVAEWLAHENAESLGIVGADDDALRDKADELFDVARTDLVVFQNPDDMEDVLRDKLSEYRERQDEADA
jgi:hypothetical protein